MADFWLGIVGTVTGSVITLVGQRCNLLWQTKETRAHDNGRKEMLKKMLDSAGQKGWRNMATLSAVIGANPEETARLLIDIGARASETKSEAWAYLKYHPLPEKDLTD